MAALQGLTPEARKFTLLDPDTVLLPIQDLRNHIIPKHPITAVDLPRPCSLPACEETTNPYSGCEVVLRANFIFSGTTPLLFGIINSPLEVTGSQVLDEEDRIVLFESAVTKQGIRELKVRTFEEVEGVKATRVTETVWGDCPWYMEWILQMIAPGVHREHMVSLLPY